MFTTPPQAAIFYSTSFWPSIIGIRLFVPSSILYLYHKIENFRPLLSFVVFFSLKSESFLSKIILRLQELTKMVCFDLSILLARRSNINMWKGDNHEDVNLVALCNQCHLSCDNQGISGRSRDRGRPTTISLGTVSVTSGCKVGDDGRKKGREGSRCANSQHYQH